MSVAVNAPRVLRLGEENRGVGWVTFAGVMLLVLILVKNQFARWLGIAFAACNMLAQMLMIQAYPFWSLALWSRDILVIYALVVHGGRSYRPV